MYGYNKKKKKTRKEEKEDIYTFLNKTEISKQSKSKRKIQSQMNRAIKGKKKIFVKINHKTIIDCIEKFTYTLALHY